MNYKILLIVLLSFSILGCENQNFDNSKKMKTKMEPRYSNTGFALIYNEELKNIKKIDDRSLSIFHKSLKRKSSVKITNPKNGKSIIANVKSNREKFSDFYNSIISKRIAEDLELNFDEPYLEIILISNKNTFVAKKSKTFDEERQVAEKAPIDGIQINDLNKSTKKKKNSHKDTFSYSIKLADFYYKNSAQMMVSKIKENTSLKNSKIK